jgi:hypothetical protein
MRKEVRIFESIPEPKQSMYRAQLARRRSLSRKTRALA